MNKREFDAMMNEINKKRSAFNQKSTLATSLAEQLEKAKKLVECAICKVNTANPIRVWRDGITLVDMCSICYHERRGK